MTTLKFKDQQIVFESRNPKPEDIWQNVESKELLRVVLVTEVKQKVLFERENGDMFTVRSQDFNKSIYEYIGTLVK